MKVVICYKEPPVREAKSIYLLWNSYTENITEGIFSIPIIVETEAETLRKLYLELVYKLGETKINGITITDLLEIRDGFSFWWMSLVVEKCNFSKSPEINDVIKFFAFNVWAKKNDVTEIVITINRRDIVKCFRIWCQSRKVKFCSAKRSGENKISIKQSGLYKIFPYKIQAFAWLFVYLVRRWKLAGVGIKDWNNSHGKVSFISYLINLAPSNLANGEFGSRIWTTLPEKLESNGVKTNWLHMYAKSNQVPDISTAKKIINNFNKNANGQQCHVMLESFLSFRIVGSMLTDWFKIVRRSRQIGATLKTVEIGGVNVWPLLEEDWNQSVFGKTAMSNFWHLNLFEKALKSIGNQEIGVYLQENMDWEFAYLWVWKAFGHNTVIGFSHSTVRFWDLRYFFDFRTYARNKKNPLPIPDRTAINGSAMRETMLNGGYTTDMLVNVEALRYNYLADVFSSVKQEFLKNKSKDRLQFLVLGDSQPQDTKHLMDTLKNAFNDLRTPVNLIVKSHPLCPIYKDMNCKIQLNITDEPLEKLIPSVDLVYTGSMTTAAVEAYLFGIPVITLLNSELLNLSPLRKVDRVYFISSQEELIKAVEEIAHNKDQVKERPSDYFYIDKELLLWKKLLQIA